MYCSACGKAIDEDGRFCSSHCGTVVVDCAHAEETDALPGREKDRGGLRRASSLFRSRRNAVRILGIFLTLATGSLSGYRHLPARMDHRSRRAGTKTRSRRTTASDELGILVRLSS